MGGVSDDGDVREGSDGGLSSGERGDSPRRGGDLRRQLLGRGLGHQGGRMGESPSSFVQYPPPELSTSLDKRRAATDDYGTWTEDEDGEDTPDGTEGGLVERDIPVREIGPRAERTTWQKVKRGLSKWKALQNAPRELWIIYFMKFLSSYSYFSFSLVMTLFLTEEFGISDQNAGWMYGMYGVMSTVFGVACGWLIDWMGVRMSLAVGALIGTATRLALAFSTSKFVTVMMLATALPFAESLGIPIMTIGIKRYTNSTNRTYAFSFYYSVMNIAALLAGPLVDVFRSSFKSGLHIFGYEFSALRLVLVSSAVTTFAMLLIVFIGIREVEVDEHGNVSNFEPGQEDPWAQTKRVLREANFWRLALFTFLLMGVRLVFRHMDATLPKYMTREFGKDAPFGLFYAINPFLIIFLVPIVGLVSKGIRSFDMILYGSFVSGASPFWVCLGNTYWAVAMFMVTLSLGEAVYSPRVYEYTMDISGRGQEGIYTSLSSAPLFMVKLVVGGMSGWLLTKYCPEEGPRHSGTMWAIIGATSFASPILMMLLRAVIDVDISEESGKDSARIDAHVRVPIVQKSTTKPVDIYNSSPVPL